MIFKSKTNLVLIISLISLVINFFLMKFLVHTNNIFLNYIGIISNIVFDISLDIFGFIFIISIVLFFDYIKLKYK